MSRLRNATLVDRLFIRPSRKFVEGSASIQLVCPHCDQLTTETVVMVLGGDAVYRCEATYDGPGCGRLYRGPR